MWLLFAKDDVLIPNTSIDRRADTVENRSGLLEMHSMLDIEAPVLSGIKFVVPLASVIHTALLLQTPHCTKSEEPDKG